MAAAAIGGGRDGCRAASAVSLISADVGSTGTEHWGHTNAISELDHANDELLDAALRFLAGASR
jgi:hypothetical protein